MATNTDAYMSGRKQYARPQAILFSNNSGIYSDSGKFIPEGYEFGTMAGTTTHDISADFLILSDDGRQPIDVSFQRIENRKRTINGRMRSYYVGDKINLKLDWQMLPSRSFPAYPDFDQTTGLSANSSNTSDGGAGGVEILRWYEDHSGPFYVFLAYDKYNNFDSGGVNKYNHLQEYNQVIQMYISSFNYTIQKRGGSTQDFWNITMGLEEV